MDWCLHVCRKSCASSINFNLSRCTPFGRTSNKGEDFSYVGLILFTWLLDLSISTLLQVRCFYWIFQGFLDNHQFNIQCFVCAHTDNTYIYTCNIHLTWIMCYHIGIPPAWSYIYCYHWWNKFYGFVWLQNLWHWLADQTTFFGLSSLFMNIIDMFLAILWLQKGSKNSICRVLSPTWVLPKINHVVLNIHLHRWVKSHHIIVDMI